MVKIIESEEEYKTITQSEGLVCVDFFAEWCGPCKAIAPVLEEMSKQMEGRVKFVKVDVDELEDVAMQEGVQAMPTFAFFKNGEKLIQFAGANPDQIQSTINQIEKGMKPLKKISSEDEFDGIVAGQKLVCVDFFATWCPPCVRIGPTLVEMAHEMKDNVEFIKVDVDEMREFSMKQGIEAMPTFSFFKNGIKLDSFSGASEEKIRSTIQKLL